MKVTIKDIADRLGISISTVSKGLNGASDISEDMRQTVLDTAIEMGYVTKSMKKPENQKVCIFVENMEYEKPGEFGYEIILGFKQAAQRDNFTVDIVPMNASIQSSYKYDNYMLNSGYSGAFFIGFSLQEPWMLQLEKTKTPTVLLDNSVDRNPSVAYIGTDNYEGIDLAIEHLYRLGHRKIAFFSGSPNSMVTSERYEAYLQAMDARNLEVTENMVAFGYYVIESAPYHIPDLLATGATAILCGSDLMAAGAVEECKKRGYRVPEDISIVGFDDLPIAKSTVPPITTIRQERSSLGKCAYFILEGLMSGVPMSRANLRARLIERKSTAQV